VPQCKVTIHIINCKTLYSTLYHMSNHVPSSTDFLTIHKIQPFSNKSSWVMVSTEHVFRHEYTLLQICFVGTILWGIIQYTDLGTKAVSSVQFLITFVLCGLCDHLRIHLSCIQVGEPHTNKWSLFSWLTTFYLKDLLQRWHLLWELATTRLFPLPAYMCVLS
jgi:hypothetical protein